jgi:hypothetical protein
MQRIGFSRCSCETGELIKNGGFEIRSREPDYPFQYWKQVNANFAIINNSPNVTIVAYEGLSAARFQSFDSAAEVDKSVSLQQTVIVTPGCSYKLSFAENLLIKGNTTAAAIPILTARVLYVDNFGNDVDLIIVPIFKFSPDHDPNRGYTFHEIATDLPVPCDVSELIVRFDYFENSTDGSVWLLDGVSLRAVSPTSACCEDNKRCVFSSRYQER